MTANELGLGSKDIALTIPLIKKAIENSKLSIDAFCKKYLPGISENEKLYLKNVAIGSGGDEWGRNPNKTHDGK